MNMAGDDGNMRPFHLRDGSRFVVKLMGMKHSGKSTIGRSIAERMGWRFLDLDDAVQLEYAREPGRDAATPVRQIYRSLGASGFADLEARAAKSLALNDLRAPLLILALGGGTIENSAALSHLSHSGPFVYLQEEPETLFTRIERGGIPPFLDPANPFQSFLSLYRRRTALYRKKADITVDLHGKDVGQAVTTVLRALEDYFRGRQ